MTPCMHRHNGAHGAQGPDEALISTDKRPDCGGSRHVSDAARNMHNVALRVTTMRCPAADQDKGLQGWAP